MIRCLILASLSLLLILSTGVAGEITFVGSTDKNPLEYQPGEQMTFSIQCLEDGKPVQGQNLLWKRSGDDGKTDSGIAVSSSDEPLQIKTSIDLPGFVRIQVFPCDSEGNILKGNQERNQFNGGAGILLDKIEGLPEPKDFDDFWNRQKKILSQVPINAKLTPIECKAPDVLVYDVKIDSSSLTPASGYLVMPKNASPKSLPATVAYHGYSVRSANINIEAGRKQIYLEINGHGILNGQSNEYYETLGRTFLKNYGFSKEENQNPDSCFWCGMMMRGLRALQYVKTLPEWDGVNLTTTGGSQGGMQCLTMAGLDPDVTQVNAYVPWFSDVSGAECSARLDSVFMPGWVEGLGYFDTSNHAKRIKCKVTIHAGLGDYVCPPSGEMVLYNSISSPKEIIFNQGMTHGFNPQENDSFSLKANVE